jgi:hypothetical protein
MSAFSVLIKLKVTLPASGPAASTALAGLPEVAFSPGASAACLGFAGSREKLKHRLRSILDPKLD